MIPDKIHSPNTKRMSAGELRVMRVASYCNRTIYCNAHAHRYDLEIYGGLEIQMDFLFENCTF